MKSRPVKRYLSLIAIIIFSCLAIFSPDLMGSPDVALAGIFRDDMLLLKSEAARQDFGGPGMAPSNHPERKDIGTVVSSSDPTNPVKTIITTDKNIKMSVIPGIKGYYRAQGWIPVQFILENSGPAVNGHIEVIINGPEGNLPFIIHRKRLDLPTGARKRAELTVLIEQPSFKVRYVSKDKTLLQTSLNLRWAEPNLNIVGVLTGEDSNMTFFKDVVSAKKGSQLAVFNDPADLPENDLGLSSLDVLIINGISTQDLATGRKKAILNWLRDGGTLIVGGGPDAAKVISGLPSNIIPVKIGASEALQNLPPSLNLTNGYTGRGPYIYSAVKRYQGKIILGDSKAPYAISKDVGKGRVIWLAFDLGARPFSEWRGNDKFWNRIISYRANNRQGINNPYNPWYGPLSGLLFNIPALKAPPLSMVLAFLFLYLILISPLNYFVLKKFDKREWAWITIPVFIAIFGVSSYWYAYIKKGGDVIINQIGVIEASPNEADAKIYNLFGIFSPGKRSYDIKIPKDMFGSPTPGNYYGGPMVALDPAIMNQESQAEISDFSIAAWTMRSFLTTGRIELK
ncbi:MAG TPA: hypothetical protein VE439_11765, partial [Anaerolineae bacterium]|nr:hypothetical protein [Anaerolineae bacterium]